MGCRMSKAKKSKKNAHADEAHIESLPADLDTMKRKDLQRLCKKHKLKAVGKVVMIFLESHRVHQCSPDKLHGQGFFQGIPLGLFFAENIQYK